ncbi:hypothetical protein FE697_004965 [Mumia zhuanghuii]|uniref:Transmembrane protein n=2 Tax=Mumia TaxID=1546255 RepID=A0ABW1QM65_9ACTN|nr:MULTISPECIES: hypothetical protein [Mumia]KAA1425224.1 hypothetical protein FE697_004965 [Mumia zhuanghuii]
MESDSEIRDQLRELERAEAAPYTSTPPTPWWYVPAAALWAGSFAALTKLTRGDDPGRIWAAAGIVGLAALIGVYVGWYQRYHGAAPSLRGRKPVEIRRVMRGYVVGAVVVLGAIVVAVALAPWWVCAAVGCVTAGAGLWWYERAYARAAAAAKARLA